MTEWIITCNINAYNVEGAFDKLDTIDWKQSTYVEKGDIVYIYVGAPMSAIRYKCEAMEVELPEATIDDSEFVLDGSSYENYGRYMRLHLLDKYDNPLLGRSKLIENGLKTVQGPSKVNSQLSAYLFSVIEIGGNVFDHFYDKKGIALKTRREAITILQRAYNRPVTARELTDIMYEIGKQQANVHAELTFMEQQRLVIKSGSSVPYGYSVVSNVGTPQFFMYFRIRVLVKKVMSDECMSRAIAILDTVFKSIESLGGSINSDLSVKIRDDIVRFRMVESQDQVKHEMTKQEAQELVKYNDDIKNHRWASKPQIRKYDKVYNGKLRIVFGERSYIRDNDSEKLEDRLGDILVTLYEKAEENRIVREAREEAERKRVEEARRREENRQRKEQEIRLVKELINKAEDYRIAKEIREYIQAMIDSGNEDITPEWIEWALKKADWYDPSIATEDEYLGKRQHEKSAEEKEKSLQDSIRKSWYW